MSRHTDQNKALVRMTGLDVREDSDQPGKYVWVQADNTGRVVGDVLGQTMANFNLSSEQWDTMDFQAQQSLVREALGEG